MTASEPRRVRRQRIGSRSRGASAPAASGSSTRPSTASGTRSWRLRPCATSRPALYRFKQEFRALADVSHPNLVTPLRALPRDGDQWFFTMELVDGVDFLEPRPRRTRARDLAETFRPAASTSPTHTGVRTSSSREGGSQRALPAERTSVRSADTPSSSTSTGCAHAAVRSWPRACAALHDAGKLHRDIKPSNVLVTPEGRVVLLDFGLVTELDPAAANRAWRFAGTPAYMSPEQGAGRRAQRGERLVQRSA